MSKPPPQGTIRVEDYVKGDLSKDTNWWGAFVVGLADNTHVFHIVYPVSVFTLVAGAILSVLLFIPAWLGIRFGTLFATILGILSMVPLTILAVAPFFTGDFKGHNVYPFHLPDGA